MRIYIVEDDLSVINILEDIIEAQGLGEICGDCGGEPANLADVLRSKPDVVLVDFFMPVKDGVEFVKELRTVNTTIKCIMISQVSAKELISKAYSAGIDFFISKPINLIEVRSVLKNVEQQITNEHTLANIRRMFMNEIDPVITAFEASITTSLLVPAFASLKAAVKPVICNFSFPAPVFTPVSIMSGCCTVAVVVPL